LAIIPCSNVVEGRRQRSNAINELQQRLNAYECVSEIGILISDCWP